MNFTEIYGRLSAISISPPQCVSNRHVSTSQTSTATEYIFGLIITSSEMISWLLTWLLSHIDCTERLRRAKVRTREMFERDWTLTAERGCAGNEETPDGVEMSLNLLLMSSAFDVRERFEGFRLDVENSELCSLPTNDDEALQSWYGNCIHNWYAGQLQQWVVN